MNYYLAIDIGASGGRHILGHMEEAPGCRKMQIAPIPNWDLRSADASYDSPAGQYVSSWKLTDPEHLDYTVTVPFGCEAQLLLPYAPKELYADSENPMFAETENGKCIHCPFPSISD